MSEAETYCLCGFQAIIQVTPAHHMQVQGRLLSFSKRPFSLGNQGFTVQGRSLAFVDSQTKRGNKAGNNRGKIQKTEERSPVCPSDT